MDSEEEHDADAEEGEQKTPKARKSKAKTSPKDQTTPVAKKLRKEKNVLPKLPKVKARRGRKPKDTEDVYNADQVAKDTKILADNPLFSVYHFCFKFPYR
jgi:cohesin complex subunit SA-1/2